MSGALEGASSRLPPGVHKGTSCPCRQHAPPGGPAPEDILLGHRAGMVPMLRSRGPGHGATDILHESSSRPTLRLKEEVWPHTVHPAGCTAPHWLLDLGSALRRPLQESQLLSPGPLGYQPSAQDRARGQDLSDNGELCPYPCG